MHALTINQLPCWNVNLKKGLSGLEKSLEKSWICIIIFQNRKTSQKIDIFGRFSNLAAHFNKKPSSWKPLSQPQKSTVVATCNCIIRVTICCNTKRRIELLKKTWKMLLLFLLRQNPFGEGTRAKMQFYGFNRMRMKRLWRINACKTFLQRFFIPFCLRLQKMS